MTEKTPEQLALENYQRSVETIINQGREDYGEATFDDLSRDVADAVGETNIVPFMAQLAECDAPARIVEHLASNPALAKKIGSMSPARRAAELGRIEARLMPDGSGAGDEPAWKSRSRNGDRPRLEDDSLSDAAWEKAYKAKYPSGFPFERR